MSYKTDGMSDLAFVGLKRLITGRSDRIDYGLV